MAKWAIELSEHDIEYRGRTAAKAQVLADFLIELPIELEDFEPGNEVWSLYVDGSSSKQGSGVGIQLISPTKEILEQSFRLAFPASNNEAEYEALIAGLRLALGIGIRKIRSYCDSQLVASQFSGDFSAKNERMDAYLGVVKRLAEEFEEFALEKIPRTENSSADALAALASTSDPGIRRVIPVGSIPTPSIDLGKEVLAINEANESNINSPPTHEIANEHDWREEIKKFLANNELPSDRWAARRLRAKSAHYHIHRGELYRHSSSGVLLKCIHNDEIRRVILETHEGAGGNHSGGRSLALKIKSQGFFWPTLTKDCEEHVSKCEKCQRHGPMINSPTELLTTGVNPYPFMRWAMDIVGPLPQSRQKKFLLVMTDYFTKWVEAEAYKSVEATDVRKFVWKNIICRHGLPYEIVTDNGTQFTSDKFEAFCARWKIRLSKSTPRYPQGNGQAEATNRRILDGLKKRLEDKKGLWADELDGVLWSHRTTPRRSTERSPFSMSHGMEAMAPAEVSVPSLRRTIMTTNPALNEQLLKDRLDQLEEQRDQALIRVANYQQQAKRYYDKKVRGRHFEEGDLVLRKVFENTAERPITKLGANWEGPYQITKIVKPGVFELMTMEGKRLPNSWNSGNLKRYYP